MKVNNSQKKLRPWAKKFLVFVAGVLIVAAVYTSFKASAYTRDRVESDNEVKVIHGVIEICINGKSYVKPVDGSTNDGQIILNQKEGYIPMQVVTVLYDEGKVVNHYVTSGAELNILTKNSGDKIIEYKQGILKAEYE
ncbi:hypothetical protein JR311_19715 (plasmid) [Bacillus velezensis]|uniref:hypothetical protein n=1 Tax=Bacillus velezensis TaxID=492670 RepID=UPI00195719D3|nr:hypothetical protein [Bacillus velezensis]QRV11411.1 hypothetical protein JR311_20530 [Bacillus velezensis]QRV11439.1 hypothetical protein JR311_19715 [Bacillus velezensis]